MTTNRERRPIAKSVNHPEGPHEVVPTSLEDSTAEGSVLPADDPPVPAKKTNVFKKNDDDLEKIAREVLAGEWGAPEGRPARLAEAGWNHVDVQKAITRILNR